MMYSTIMMFHRNIDWLGLNGIGMTIVTTNLFYFCSSTLFMCSAHTREIPLFFAFAQAYNIVYRFHDTESVIVCL